MNESIKKGCGGAVGVILCLIIMAGSQLVSSFLGEDEAPPGPHGESWSKLPKDSGSKKGTSKKDSSKKGSSKGGSSRKGSSKSEPKRDGAKAQDAAKKRAEQASRSGRGPAYPDVPVGERGNRTLESFPGATRHLMKIHGDKPRTFYCRCGFEPSKSIDLKECGYEVRKNKSRAARVEFEHVVPASVFGHQFDEWTKGHPACERKGKRFKGRSCAQKVSTRFQLMESDMYNLQPAVGEVNGDRLHYPMAEIPGEAREYGKCDVEIEDQLVEPASRIRGDIARTYFYMDWAYPEYGIIRSQAEREMFERWAAKDPVDRWERKRARRIAEVQGNTNPFVE